MGNINSKSQDVDDFLNDLAMHETTMSLGLCLVCLMYSFTGLRMLKWLHDHSENTNTSTDTIARSAKKFQQIQRTFFYIQNLLFAIIIRCSGRYPSSPYSNKHDICVYQGMMENTGGYASFLLSLTLALLAHLIIVDKKHNYKNLEKRSCVKRFIEWWTGAGDGKWSVGIIYGTSIVLAAVIAYLSNFCHSHNTNAKQKIHLVFYIPLIIICFIILYIFCHVWKNLGDKLHVNDPCKLLCCHHSSDESKLNAFINSNSPSNLTVNSNSNANSVLGETSEVWRKIEKLILLNVLFFPLIMIICFTPGIIKKIIDYITDDNTPFIFKFLHIAFQCIYGAIVATTCFYIIYYNTKLSLLTFKRVGRDETSVASPRTTTTQMNVITNPTNSNDHGISIKYKDKDDHENDDVRVDQDENAKNTEKMVGVGQVTIKDEKEGSIIDDTVQLQHNDFDAKSCEATKGLSRETTGDNTSSQMTIATTNNQTDLSIQRPPSINTTTVRTIDIESGLVTKVEISKRRRHN